jgi:succinate dehydrogenase / fumarate reductase, membrane anchor subunit
MLRKMSLVPRRGALRWLIQRFTALAVATLSIFLWLAFLLRPATGFEGWKTLLSSNWIRLATLMLLLSLFAHAWIGIRDVLIDYVKPAGVGQVLRTIVALLLSLYAVWAVKILWG